MKILLLHPDDSMQSGPWSGMHWDLVVDLGWSGRCANAQLSSALSCPVRSIQEIPDPSAHASWLRETLWTGLGELTDSFGIDWWELANPYRAPLVDQILTVSHLAADLPQTAEVFVSRPHLSARILSRLRAQEAPALSPGTREGIAYSLKRYIGLWRTFTPASLLQIALDKWDTDYSLRRWFAPPVDTGSTGFVLLPSAYRNVTRTQAAFAQLLPQRKFLSVVTRRDGRILDSPPNILAKSLASYAARSPNRDTEKEIATLQRAWPGFISKLTAENQELRLAEELGVFKDMLRFLESGLRIRDAWNTVLNKEKIISVISADENNPYTRLPILLARQQGIPTLYTEHGALNFNLGLRALCSDRYLARGEMLKDYWLNRCHVPEGQIAVGSPRHHLIRRLPDANRDYVVLFSSDYESTGGRGEGFYREVLPPLCDIAAKNGRKLVLKLHPFESLADRSRLVKRILTTEEQKHLEVLGGPLDWNLLDRTWAAITVESSAAVECALAGIPAFLCGWFDCSWWEYSEQFERFGVAQSLCSPGEIADIPNRIKNGAILSSIPRLSSPITPERLEEVMGITSTTPAAIKAAIAKM